MSGAVDVLGLPFGRYSVLLRTGSAPGLHCSVPEPVRTEYIVLADRPGKLPDYTTGVSGCRPNLSLLRRLASERGIATLWSGACWQNQKPEQMTGRPLPPDVK